MNDATRPGANGGAQPDFGWGIAPAGHRLPADTRLGPVQLQVADLERSLRYYQQVIGLRLLEKDGSGATLGAEDQRPLVVLKERPGSTPVPPRGRLGLYHFAILLPTREDLGRFLRHVGDLRQRIGASDHLVSEAVYLHDPDGLGIEVYADRPRSAWRAEGRELRMSTEPLRAHELLASAGDLPWAGLPDGTVIGHVHLHVGDLGSASSFYHDALGFDKVVWSYPGALFLSAGGYHHHLGVNTWAASERAAGEGDARLLEWTVELPRTEQVEATAESLVRAGYPVERPAPGEVVTRDPWGTLVRMRRGGAA